MQLGVDWVWLILGVVFFGYGIFMLRRLVLGVGWNQGGWKNLSAKERSGICWLLGDGPTAMLVLGVGLPFVREWPLLLPAVPIIIMRIAIPLILSAENSIKSDYRAGRLPRDVATSQWNRFQRNRQQLQILQSAVSFPIALYGLFRLQTLMLSRTAVVPAVGIALALGLFLATFGVVLFIFIAASNAVAD